MAVNDLERERVEALERRVCAAFGSTGLGQQVLRLAARAAAAWWRLRVRHFGDGIQPRTLVDALPAGRPAVAAAPLSTGKPKKAVVLRQEPARTGVGVGNRG